MIVNPQYQCFGRLSNSYIVDRDYICYVSDIFIQEENEMKLVIVIPAYNEEAAIEHVLKSLPKKIEGIDDIISLVVDDGSTDKTAEKASQHAGRLVQHAINLGVGAATITGLEAAKKLGADIVVTMDADGQHNPKDIRRVILPILEKNVDVVVGTRMYNAEGMPKFKIFGNHMMNVMTLIVFRKWSSDSQSGMKAFNRKALRKICLHSMGYEICSEIVGEIKRNRLKHLEVPIEVLYSSYSKQKGQSWMNGVNILTKILTIKIAGRK